MKTILKLSFATSISFFVLASIASAQLIPDETLGKENSQVVSSDNQQKIGGGAIRGKNLFHSFQEFNVERAREVLFNNSSDIENIFTRVTGGNLSKINGVISNVGQANLFLINPAGIIFGEGARLQLGGSFLGSTANSIVFPDGEFSATNLDNPPLLTINVPIGLNFRDEPQPIINRSIANDIGLEISEGNTISLVGGDIQFEGGKITAQKANVWLGGLSTSGIIGISENNALIFLDDVARSEIFLTNGAEIVVFADERGSINLTAKNLLLSNGSLINAIVNNSSNYGNARAGNIIFQATDRIIIDSSEVRYETLADSQVNSSNISIKSQLLILQNGTVIESFLTSKGTGASINLNTNTVIVQNGSNITSELTNNGRGRGGDINITTDSLLMTHNFLAEPSEESANFIIATTSGQGDAGNVNIHASEIVFSSNLKNQVNRIQTIAKPEPTTNGNAGNININTDTISLTGKSLLSSTTRSLGNAGDITINASEKISLTTRSLILSQVKTTTEQLENNVIAQGTGGNIQINTPFLSVNNFSLITANTFGQSIGNAGKVTINADTVRVSNDGIIDVSTTSGSNSNAGKITIDTDRLELLSGGKLISGAESGGNAGNIELNARTITLDGSNTNPRSPELEQLDEPIFQKLEGQTGIFVNTLETATGNAGNIIVKNTESVNISNNAQISSDSQGQGNGGNLFIEANDLNLNNGFISAEIFAGEKGVINLEIADTIFMQNNSKISARAFNDADGGNINIDTDFIVAAIDKNNDIIANANMGMGGDINITAEALFGIEERRASNNNNTNDIDASSNFGLNGNISLETPDVDPTSGIIELPGIPIDAEAILARDICKFEREKIAKGSSFIITGRGGLTPTSKEPLDNLDNVVRWAERNEIQVSENGAVGVRQRSSTTSHPMIKQSQGWVETSDGSVWLVANSPQSSRIIHPHCENL